MHLYNLFISQVFECLLVITFVTCTRATLSSLFGGGNNGNGNGPKTVKIIHINRGGHGHGGHYSPPPIINFIVPDNGHGQHYHPDHNSGSTQIIKVIQEDINSGWQSDGGGGWPTSGNGGWNNGWDQ